MFFVNLLSKLFLSLFKSFSRFGVVFLQVWIFKHEFVNVFLHWVVLCHSKVSIWISLKDFNLSFKLCILFVKKIYLVFKLLNCCFILFMLVFQIQLLKILCRSEHFMKTKDFLISDINLWLELLSKENFRLQLLLKLHNLIVINLASLISFADFICPLILVNKNCVLNLLTTHSSWHSATNMLFLKKVCHFHALLMSLKQIGSISIIELTKPINNLVLPWKVNFIKSLL